MAKRKRTKKEKGLWVGLSKDQYGSNDERKVYFFTSKPTVSMEDCYDCGSQYPILNGKLVAGLEDGLCQDGFEKATGLKLEVATPVKVQLTVVS